MIRFGLEGLSLLLNDSDERNEASLRVVVCVRLDKGREGLGKTEVVETTCLIIGDDPFVNDGRLTNLVGEFVVVAAPVVEPARNVDGEK